MLEDDARRELRSFCYFADGRDGNATADQIDIRCQERLADLLSDPQAFDGASINTLLHLQLHPDNGNDKMPPPPQLTSINQQRFGTRAPRWFKTKRSSNC